MVRARLIKSGSRANLSGVRARERKRDLPTSRVVDITLGLLPILLTVTYMSLPLHITFLLPPLLNSSFSFPLFSSSLSSSFFLIFSFPFTTLLGQLIRLLQSPFIPSLCFPRHVGFLFQNSSRNLFESHPIGRLYPFFPP